MSTADDQMAFLEELADDVHPIFYYDTNGERHRVMIQSLAQTAPYKHEGRLEPVCQISMIEVWPGVEVRGADAAKVQTLTASSLYDHVPALWDGNSLWGFFQWG
jgi:hypothetical protein